MNHAEQFFDALAPYYDDVYSEDRARSAGHGEKVAFYLELAREADGPVLEVGCGTGRVYLELLAAGVDAYGFDVSAGMLDELERGATDRGLDPSVRQADMADFEPRRTYDLVVIPGRGFLHNVTRTDQQRTLRRIRDALADDGRLVCNFLTPDLAAIGDEVGRTETRTFDHGGEEYTFEMRDEFEDEIAQVVRGERAVRDGDGEVVAETSFRIKLVSRDEFALLLETAGYSDWEVYGGFDREPLTAPDQEMVWFAEP